MRYTKTISLLLASALSAIPISAEDLTKVPLNPEEFTKPPARSMPGILWFWSQTEMTDEVIREQMDTMKDAGFSGIMMFPLQYKPKFYSEHFYERFKVVLEEAKKRDMVIWMTVDSAIPTGHGSQQVVPGGKVSEVLTLEPREDLKAQVLLHGPKELKGGKSIDLQESFPGISNLPSTVQFQGGVLRIRKAPMISLVEGAEWTDYNVKAKITANNWAGNPLIVAGYIENGMLLRWDRKTNSGYAWSLADQSELDKDGGKGTPVLRRAVYKNGKIINRMPSIKIDELEHGKDYVFEVKVNGTTIESYVDGKLVDTVEDKTYANGTAGIYTPNLARSVFHDMEVKSGDKVLYSTDFKDTDAWISWAPNAKSDRVFCVSAVPRVDGKLQAEGIVDLTEHFKNKTSWEAPEGDWRLEYFMTKDAKMPYNYPDLFNDDAIIRHQKIIYEEMYRRFPEHMGSTIQGFWSDEPHRPDDDVWSHNFPVKFERNGVNMAECLAAVYNDLGRKGKILRAPYYKEVTEGWTEPFAKFQGEWCRERGLDWMTNPTCDSAPPYGGYTAGNALQMNQWSNAPGVDAIFGQILPNKRSYISRWATSSANQFGNQHVLYEVYGGYGWDVTPDLIRYVNGYLMVRGCNRVSFHAYWTNPDKVGYAPPFDPSSTYWFAQDEINMWNGRLQEANLGKAISDVALLVPNSTQYSDHLNQKGREMNSHWGQAYYGLEDQPICFDLVDESNIDDNPIMRLKGKAVDGGLQVGEQTYKVIVVPAANTLSLKAIRTLKAAAEKGAKVIAYANMPKEAYKGDDAALAAEVKELFGEKASKTPREFGKGWTAFVRSQAELAEVVAHAKVNVVAVSPANPKIQVLKRVRENATVYIFMNEGETPAHSTITFDEKTTPEIWNAETGGRQVAPTFTRNEGRLSVPLSLNPYELKVVTFMNGAADVPHLTDASLEATAVASVDETLVADIHTARTGEHTLKGVFGDKKFTGSVTLADLPATISITDGWQYNYADKPEEKKPGLGNWLKERPTYSGAATYSTSFEFPESGKNANLTWTLDLGDVKDLAEVTINGKELPVILWRPYTVDLTEHLKAGANTLSVKVTNTLGNKKQTPIASGLVGGVSLKPMHKVKVTLK